MNAKGQNIKSEMKYRDAISLYSNSSLSIKEICEQTGVSFSAFSSYLSKYHRPLILERHHLADVENVKLRGEKGQTTAAHYKYKDAIAACDSMEYIEYNISQIARIFNVAPCSLLGQLRRHYSDIIPRREKVRRKRGLSTNQRYGARDYSKDVYAVAVESLQASDMTLEEVATVCRVSHTGLREHVILYYPQITQLRKEKRFSAEGQKVKGMRNGRWCIHEPIQSSVQKYEQAIELYRTTSMPLKEIVRISGVGKSGFRHYLRTWYPELIVQRRGFDGHVDIANTKRYRKDTAEKYAAAIERMKTSDFPTAKIAAEFGLNAEVFRMYLKEHHPDLVAVRGMMMMPNGKVVSQRSALKYAEAVRLYENSDESLKSIAQRLGLTYNSLGGFIRRNYPELVKKRHSNYG